MRTSKAHIIRILRTVLPIAAVLIVLAFFGIRGLAHHAMGIEVSSTSEMSKQVCSGNQKIKNAAAYAGNGPHKIYIGTESSVIQQQPLLTSYDQLVFHPDPTPQALQTFTSLQKDISPGSVAETSLVGCISRVNESNTGKTCDYDVGALHVYDAHYQLNVYVARTHKLIKSVKLTEQTPEQFACPQSVYFDPANNRQYLPYDETKLLETVKPLIQNKV